MKSELSNACHALDNDQKVAVIKLVLEKGQTTVTEVRNSLNLSFSTAHKYLNQLEDAKLITSKSTFENGKKKRIYTIKDFSIKISPKTLLENSTINKEKDSNIEIVSKIGMKTKFNLTDIKNTLTAQGLSPSTAGEIVYKLKANSFKGMFAQEIEEKLTEIISHEIQKLNSVKREIIFPTTKHSSLHKSLLGGLNKDLLTIFEERGLHKAILAHKNGGLYIRNPEKPYPINLQHNLSLLLKYGPQIIGLDSKPSKRIDSALGHVELMLNAVKDQLSGTQQSIDYLNVYLAPYLKNLSKKEVEQAAQALMFKINDLCKISGVQIGLGIEMNVPKHLKDKPAYVGGKQVGTYSDYEAETIQLRDALLEQAAFENFTFPKLMLKFRKRKPEYIENLEYALNNTYIINLNPAWQSTNAFYTLDWARLSYDYDEENGSTGTGELQGITINAPRLAYSKKENKLTELIDLSKKVFHATAEEILSGQYSRMGQLTFPSHGKKYVDLEDGLFLLKLSGIKEYLEQTNQTQKDVPALLKRTSKLLNKDVRLRVELCDIDFKLLNQRFAELDNQKFKTSKKYYHGGLNLNLSDEETIKYQDQ
ncbi:MAG: hypothetical protein GOV15_01260, partial [Candidatus Diapherotrites archaeon]|nr:hypothetical protein [Candidatus Diapherotrites archaeon]